ncbi:TIM barrel protein [Pontiellaceae bacterium B12219]|nr:TIM barrel protein [Pontiellaceae bacterium B12219]
MHTMKTGICSITFAQKQPEEVVALVKQAGLDAIEWAGNVHVQPGELKTASRVRKMTEEAGLKVSSYGSYWKAVDSDGTAMPFEPVLESALTLGTDTIRVWAGTNPSDAATDAQREKIVTGFHHALDQSRKLGINLALEFHANTLSDSNTATMDFLDEINHPNLFTYWQPIYWITDPVYRLEGLKQLSDRVLNMHVFHWMFRPGAGSWIESTDRRPLDEGSRDWNSYFSVPLNSEMDHYALMEFVRGDDPEQFLKDAAVLRHWVAAQYADALSLDR